VPYGDLRCGPTISLRSMAGPPRRCASGPARVRAAYTSPTHPPARQNYAPLQPKAQFATSQRHATELAAGAPVRGGGRRV